MTVSAPSRKTARKDKEASAHTPPVDTEASVLSLM